MFDGLDTTVQAHFVPRLEMGVWIDRIAPHLEQMASGSGGRFLPIDIRLSLVTGHRHLWLALEGASILCVMVTEIVEYPRCHAMRIVGLVGHRPRRWMKLLPQIEHVAATLFNCSLMEVMHNPAHARLLPGYEAKHWLSEKVIAV